MGPKRGIAKKGKWNEESGSCKERNYFVIKVEEGVKVMRLPT